MHLLSTDFVYFSHKPHAVDVIIIPILLKKNLRFREAVSEWKSWDLNPSSLGEGNGTLLQYSCLENPLDGGGWWAAVHGVATSQSRLSNFTFTHWRRKRQPTPVFLRGESQGRGSLVGCHLWGCTVGHD